jgi:hypothetical protein
MKKAKRYNGEDGSMVEDDAMESANKGEDLAAELRGENTLTAMRDTAAKPKPKPKAKPAVSAPKLGSRDSTAAAAPTTTRSVPDETKMSLSDRLKMSRERAKTSSTGTDTRSVGQRLRSAFGMKNGGSASSRADGVASKGKTRGRMC